MAIDMGFNNLELVGMVRDYADQKGIDVGTVIDAVVEAIKSFEISRYKYDKIVVTMDKSTGKVISYKELLVVENERFQHLRSVLVDGYEVIALDDARSVDPSVKLGDIVLEALPSVSLGGSIRYASFSKGVLRTKLNEAIREKRFNTFKDSVGDIVIGLVKRVDARSLTVDVHNTEVVIPSSNLIKGEIYRHGDRIKAYLESVSRAVDGVHLTLTRTSNRFVERLLFHEVPEIYDGIVKVEAVARSPGSRTKVAVTARDGNTDPIGACVGMKGVRIQAIIEELRGEKIDIVEYSSDPAKFVINALSPAEISKVVMDEESRRIEVVVPENHLSVAIGKRGQNVGLTSVLVGWRIDILSEKEEMERRNTEVQNSVETFVGKLDVEPIIAQLLVSEDFFSIADIVGSTVQDLAKVEGFDEDIASEIRERAVLCLQSDGVDVAEDGKNVDGKNNLLSIPEITPDMLTRFSEHHVDTVSDLADLSRDEVKDIMGTVLVDNKLIDDIIMLARERSGWFS